MKKFSYLFIAVFTILSFSFTSCKKDDASKANQFTVDGTDYEMGNGYYRQGGIGKQYTEGYFFGIILTSPELTIDNNFNFTGAGALFLINILSPSETEIAAGSYYYDAENEMIANSIYPFSIILLNYSEESEGEPFYISGGKLEIEKTDTEYELTFDGYISGGKEVNMHYKGTLTELVNAPVKKLWNFEK